MLDGMFLAIGQILTGTGSLVKSYEEDDVSHGESHFSNGIVD